MRHWWEDAVFYQIYPRSFMDTNGDGIGDLAGITRRMDYLAALGVDALWISPFFPSPLKDFGYDVSDYRGIDPMFGTRDDFIALVAAAKARGIHIVLDLVANHSSNEHPWFQAASSSKSDPKHDWYLWTPDTGRAPNNWIALFELASAWQPNPATGERYLATFTKYQPEFNWRNPEVRREFYDIMRSWYDLGVDGFRLDVATAYVKDEQLRSNPFSVNLVPDLFQHHIYDRNRPEFHQIFKEMRQVADAAGERVLIGETHGLDSALAASCHGKNADELHMAFNFDFLTRPWSARAFHASVERWYKLLPADAWPNFTLSNHDQPRHAWRYRSSLPALTEARARVAAAMLLTLRGTPFLYYGEELGMTCVRIPRKRLADPLGINTWPLAFLGRDPERTPMQWDASPQAGFSPVEPWLPVNPDYRERNVAAQDEDPDSLLNWYRRLTALRRARAALREGVIRFAHLNPYVFAYRRIAPDEPELLILLNFASRPRLIELPEPGQILLGSQRAAGTDLPRGSLELAACEVLILELR